MTMRNKKILLVVSEDWYFCSHRLDLGTSLVEAGAEVAVVTQVGKCQEVIQRAGIRVIPLNLARSGHNPFRDFITICRLILIYRREKPDIIHHVALKPSLYGAIAAWVTRMPAVVNALGGMGFIFISERFFARLVRKTTGRMFRFLMNRKNTLTILQNHDDISLYKNEIGVEETNLTLIKGSGVDLKKFDVKPEPNGIPVAVCVSRMLWDKGIGELVEAARILSKRNIPIKVRLVGPTDVNPSAISQQVLDSWKAEGVVDIAGPQTDIASEYHAAHIGVLPSYREGLPKSLLEAAACGRAIVASDVPGCREVCRHQVTGLLHPAKNVKALADALTQLATNKVLRQKLGRQGRLLAESEFGVASVITDTISVYDRLLR